MNRNQRKFAGISRLMRSRSQFAPAFGSHGPRRWKDGEAGAKGGAAAPLELEPVNFAGRSYNLNEAIKIRDEAPAEDLTGYLETIRYNMRQALKHVPRGGDDPEVFAKARADLEKVIGEYQATLKDYRDHLRTVPERGDAEGGRADLRRVELRYSPVWESDRNDKFISPYLGQMTRAQFNLTCRTVDDLGLEDKKTRAKVTRLQLLHDVIALVSEYQARKSLASFMRGGWEALPWAAEYKQLAAELGQSVHETRLAGPAINETNAEEGKNWVPGPILSARILPLIEEELVLLRFFETVTMPGPQYDIGVIGSHIKSRKLNENILDDGSSSGAKIVADYFKTKKLSFTAKLHAAGAVVTPSWIQDAVVQSQFILTDLAYAIARGREDWMLNGQLTAALDGVTIAADDIRKMGDGLRYWYSLMKAAAIIADVDFSAGLTAEGIVKMFGQQKSYGNRAARSIFVCNTATMAQLLVLKTTTGRDVVLTMNQLGPAATIRTGSLGQMFGRDIVTVNDLADSMDATGIIPAAPGDRSVLLHVFTEAVKVGSRLGIQVDYSTDYRFFEYQEAFRAVARDDITRAYDPATEPFISQGVGIRKV